MAYLISEFSQLGAQLRAIRKSKGLTQADIREKTGFSATLIVKIENGEMCSMSAVLELCNALGVRAMMALELNDEDLKKMINRGRYV
jgi:Uncharacterized protein conserved in bacteria